MCSFKVRQIREIIPSLYRINNVQWNIYIVQRLFSLVRGEKYVLTALAFVF